MRSHDPSRAGEGSALEALVDAAAGILAAGTLADTLSRIAHHLHTVCAHDEVSVYEVDEAAGMLVPVFAVGSWAAETMNDSFPVTVGITGWVVRHRRTRVQHFDEPNEVIRVIEGTPEESDSLVSVPLVVGDRVVAVMNVYRVAAHERFTDEEIAQIERFATMAALAFESARQRDTLREQAQTDGLTGLLNHRVCHERLRVELEAAQTAQVPLGLVVLDLDHFKAVNDAFGHAEGDRLLVAAAERIVSAVRSGDVVGRMGGEEFAVILPGADADRATEAAERMRAAVAEIEIGGGRLSCSAGVAASPQHAGDAATLFELADGALYWAKRAGRDQTRQYDSQLAGELSHAGQRREVEALLADPGAIEPVFQPLVELATGRVAGYEALARMPGGPIRPPDQWFAQAHRCGLGAELEAAALRAALAVPDRPPLTFLALNVSPGALLSAEVAAVLDRDLEDVVIELTEHELFSSDSALDDVLVGLRERGARIALDDAGNGYSGLQQIIRIAPEIIKLDRSLVDGVAEDRQRLALLDALISFAATTRAVVCAEGVETFEDLGVLAALDVGYAQGWALARPAAPWVALAPDVAEATAAAVHTGVRVVRSGSPGELQELTDLLSAVRSADDIRPIADLLPAALAADEAAVARLVEDGAVLEDISLHDWSEPGERYRLSDYPSTDWVMESRRPGQIVTGDAACDPAELELLEQAGFKTVLLVPLVFGDRAVGLLELYRRHAQPFSAREVEQARLLGHQLAAVLYTLDRRP